MARSLRSTRKRTSKPAEERLDDLLNAAGQVFSKRGVSDSTVDEITERAGVSKGTFYLYFKAKEDVVGALWQRYIDGFLATAEGILEERELGFLPRLTKLFEELTAYVLRNANLHRLVYRGADSLEFSRLNNQKLIVMMADAVKRGVEAGDLIASDPDLLVRILFHGICGALHDAISSKEPIDDGVLIHTAGRLARSTFAPSSLLSLSKPVGVKPGPARSPKSPALKPRSGG